MIPLHSRARLARLRRPSRAPLAARRAARHRRPRHRRRAHDRLRWRSSIPTKRTVLGRVDGLGDLSHASAVFSRDQRYAFVFGRDGGLTKIDLLRGTIVKRVIQAGNAIGGAISDDGTLVAVSNYDARAACGCSMPRRLRRSPTFRRSAPTASPRRRSASSICRAAASSTRSTMPARSGSRTSRSGEAPALTKLTRHRQAALRRQRHARRPALSRRPVRRGRRRARRSVARAARGRAHSRRLRPRRGEAAGLQDAASRRLGRCRRRHADPGGRPPRADRGRCARPSRKSAASRPTASRCSRWRGPTAAMSGSISPIRSTTRSRWSTP